MKIIDLFSAGFMFILAFVFYLSFNQTVESDDYLRGYLVFSPFAIGVLLNGFNFLQLPFWTGWNLYLINEKYISIERSLKYYYLAGTMMGIFLGMFSLIVALQAVLQKTSQFSSSMLPVVIPLFFIVLGTLQIYKVIKKYFRH